MSAKLNLKIENRHEELDRIVAALEEMGEQEDWSPELMFRVHLVVEELVLNVMDYGFDEGLHEFYLNLNSEPESLTIEIVDDGKPFDPLHDAPIPDVNAPMEERRIGGLGIHLVRTMMDETTYCRENDLNRLTLVAKR